MMESALALARGVSKRLYVVMPAVLLSALAVAGEITGESVVLAPQDLWIAVGVVAGVGVFLQYHHERLVRIACEKQRKAVIWRLVHECRDLEAAIRHGAVRGDEARQAFAAFVQTAEREVRGKTPFYFDPPLTARGPVEREAWLEALRSLEEALVDIGRQL